MSIFILSFNENVRFSNVDIDFRMSDIFNRVASYIISLVNNIVGNPGQFQFFNLEVHVIDVRQTVGFRGWLLIKLNYIKWK